MALKGFSYRLKFALSYVSLLAESLWSSFWPALSIAFLFASLALLNIFTAFGEKTHLFTLLLFFGAFLFACRNFGGAFHPPNRHRIERRIERESGLAHRPLETLQDKPVEGIGADIWQAHLKRTQEAMREIKIVSPYPSAARQDRYNLRTAALLLLVIGFVVAGGAWKQRLADGFTPDVAALIDQKPVALDAWITPPEYTRQAPVFLATAQLGATPEQGEIAVPAGSVLKVRVSGYASAPRLAFSGAKIAFTEAADKSFTLETKLETSGDLKISRWWVRTLGAWKIRVIPDLAPEISFLMTDKTPRAGLKISYSARDDYGLRKITATFMPLPELAAKMAGPKTYSFNIPVSASAREVLTHVEDLAPHPLAGSIVMMTLAAEDHAGNVAVTEEKSVLLPERGFTSPAAQAVIAERKRLLWFQDPIAQRLAADGIARVANQPQNYKGDIVVFMSLVSAIKRLGYAGDDRAAVETLQGLLWEAALRIEDGGLSMAARDLSEALQKLSEALNDPATSEERLKELADDVQRKMMEYMQAMANEMQQRMAEGKNTPQMPPEIAEKMMQHIDMGALMKQLQDMAKGDSREQMKKMAEFMKNALDNLDMKKMDEMQQSQQKALEAMQKMQDLVRQQQSLMDKTAKKNPASPDDDEAREQQQIRDALGEATRELSEYTQDLPENLSAADQAMKQSREKLAGGDAQGSLPHQKTAIDELQKGLDQSIAQMAQQMKQMILSFGAMPKGNRFGEGFDPLGRGEDGKGPSDEEIEIPQEKERRRVQEIIKELRSRSNDFERPKVEREYIDRLLEMFY